MARVARGFFLTFSKGDCDVVGACSRCLAPWLPPMITPSPRVYRHSLISDPAPPLFDIFVFILAPLKGIESTVMFVKGVRALRKRIHSDWFGEMM